MIKIKHDIANLSVDLINQGSKKSSSTGARQSYTNEAIFQLEAYKDKEKQPVSFSLHNQHYGKLNNSLMSLQPNEDKLVTINAENDLQVLDFVADAYFAFFEELQSFKISNRFSPQSKIYNFEAKGKKENLDQKYDLFLQDQYSYFLSFVNSRNLNNKIADIDSFLVTFSDFVSSRTPATPYAKSSFVYSNRISRKLSGLVIDLDTGDPNDDPNKINNYIDDEDFNCFQDLANSFGFVVNKDIPWQIVADLNSVEMKYYFHLRTIRSIEEGTEEINPIPETSQEFSLVKDSLNNFDLINYIFNINTKYYFIVNLNDLENLKKIIYYFYNSYIDYRPTINTTELVKEFNSLKIKQSTQNRKFIFERELETKIIKNKLIRLYIFIKAREVNANWSQSRFETVVRKTTQIQKEIDNQAAMKYVQREVNLISKSKQKQNRFYF